MEGRHGPRPTRPCRHRAASPRSKTTHRELGPRASGQCPHPFERARCISSPAARAAGRGRPEHSDSKRNESPREPGKAAVSVRCGPSGEPRAGTEEASGRTRAKRKRIAGERSTLTHPSHLTRVPRQAVTCALRWNVSKLWVGEQKRRENGRHQTPLRQSRSNRPSAALETLYSKRYLSKPYFSEQGFSSRIERWHTPRGCGASRSEAKSRQLGFGKNESCSR